MNAYTGYLQISNCTLETKIKNWNVYSNKDLENC